MESKINVPTISLDEAVDRVTRFHDQLVVSVPESNIPRAIFIPISDLLAIIDQYETINGDGANVNELSGVRAYFAVKESDENLNNDVTAVIVPVDKKNNDIIYKAGTDKRVTEIYDFTQPCPTFCDTNSPLFIK